MRWIDFENKKPTDTDIPGWTPWTKAEWNAWQDESKRLLGELQKLHDADKIKERNVLIDANANHWSKLKPWLFALSHNKCWFTEGRDICSHKDVEHFRPKKEALNLDGSVRDGYWWLAFDYSNYRASGNVPNRKKGGWFPLHESSLCSKFDARCEQSEQHYLLDPVNAADTELIAFNEEGNAIPAPGVDDWSRERVLVSIERLKLNEHDDLPAERRRLWQIVNGAIDAYLSAKSSYHPKKNPGAKNTLKEKAGLIKRMAQADAELSSVAKWCVLFRNEPELLQLVA
jgi:hypothetical protein